MPTQEQEKWKFKTEDGVNSPAVAGGGLFWNSLKRGIK